MATKYAAAAADLVTGRPRKRARLGWDVASAAEAQIGTFCGQEVGDVASLLLSANPSDHTCSSLLPKGVARNASPPWREDDKDGHYVFAVGENLASRYKIYRKMGEGTFGQVLECWDRESKEMVAIKIVRSVKKYSDAAMIEIDVLQKLAKNDAAGKQ
ncbi:Serine/threonine-protein kinase AFC2 [Zea mays]|uniref:Serine/threonine-protein kinase AFC2 n=1 Tax=Zea mays TaxID=4577 RepID=A0A1D6ELZ8_MAIZE|nr:Serine/threonine-protein kinase AFC2 [Zea mays]